jgi:tetratricopeptide (TPR) repeat protein
VLLAVGGFLAGDGAGGRPEPGRVLVAPLENRSGEATLDPVGSMAADWLIEGLAHTRRVEVVPLAASLAAARFAGEHGGASPIEQSHVLAAETGAAIVVSGAYYLERDSIWLSATVVDVAGDRVLHAFEPFATPRSRPLEGVEELRRRVMGLLATHLDPRLRDHVGLRSVLPSYEAYVAYARGVELATVGEWGAAIPSFAEAAEQDSTFVAPLVWEGLTHFSLGDFGAVDSILRLARPRIHLLPELGRIHVELLEARLDGDLERAYRATRRVSELAPGGTAEWGHANSSLWVNRPEEALRILGRLDPERGALRGWLLFWVDWAGAHHRLGRHREELEVARRAGRLFPDDPGALLLEARALAALGRHREVARVLSERSPPGDLAAASLLRSVGLELRRHGWVEEGVARLRESLARGRAARADAAVDTVFLARAHMLVGEVAEAERLLRVASGEAGDEMAVRGLAGVLAARSGRVAAATEASEWLASLDRPWLHGTNTYWRARIAASLGRRSEASHLLQRSYEEGMEVWDPAHVEPDFDPLRGYPPFEAFLRPRG